MILLSLSFVLKVCCVATIVCWVSAEAPIVTSVGYIFETFTPYALIRFFEFSDKEWNITQNCFADMYEYIEGLRHGEYWALKLYDASSYYSGAIFSGQNMRLQNPHLCSYLSRQFNEFTYKLDEYAYVISFDVQIISAHYLMEITYDNYFKYEKIQQLICFPKSCRNLDLQEILEVLPPSSNAYVRNNTFLRHRIVQNNYNIWEDFNFYVLLIIIFGAVLIHLTVFLVKNHINTVNRYRLEDSLRPKVLKIVNQQISQINKNPISPLYDISRNLNKNRIRLVNGGGNRHCFENLLESISLPSIIYDLLQHSSTPLSGVMSAFTISYVFMHLLAEITFMASNMDFGLVGSRAEYRELLIRRSSYIMDVYFLINGAYLAYEFLKNFPKDTLSIEHQLKHIWKITMQKLFGLTPSYIFGIYAAHLLDKHFYHNVILEIPSRDYKNCAQRLLNNIFYIDTFLPLKDRCVPWTWCISLDVQFFLVGCLIMLLMKVHACYALVIGISIFSIAFMAAMLWLFRSNQEYGYSTSFSYEVVCFNLIVDNICLFIMPYLLGLCLGYIIFKTNHNLQLNLLTLASGWVLCFIMLGFIFFGYELIEADLNPWLKAFCEIISHVLWCNLIIWLILTTTTKYAGYLNNFLNCKYTYILEQLTSTCVILSPIIIRCVMFTGDTLIYWSLAQLIPLALGCIILIYLAALILYILLQGPVVAALGTLISTTSN